ncbi:MAG: hypothetical protein CL947_02075 [Epsilonproteobacteria bacterium]|nr:hypothetical protein [Campylobacterota bacterium]|tara:strand:- start:1143 stop:1673 length:531 start_codon:yes stop_codon:yes gene_type:complete
MKKLFSMLSAGICLMTPGCKDTRLEQHKNRTPKINLQKFFDGTVKGYGSFFDWRGRQTRSFTITMIGDFDKNNKGPLKEHFVFSDGSKLNREWTVQFDEQGNYTATAPDIVGTGHGQQMGNAAYTDYVITIPYGDSSVNITMDDWCYMVDDNKIINKAAMKKFGFKVAELVIFLEK